MKKLILVLVCAVLLTGCAQKMPQDYDRIKEAKKLYEELDSARIVMTDLNSGAEVLEFSFYLNKDDEMVFSYRGFDGGGEERAYSDGAQFFYKTADEEGWHIIGSDDESYLYNRYNKTYRYPYARGSIFFLDGTSVSSASTTEKSDGSFSITYVYDSEGLNNYAAGRLENVSEFSSLTAVYELNPEGYITSFTQTGTVSDENGVASDINMRLDVFDMNGVYEIPYPVGELILE